MKMNRRTFMAGIVAGTATQLVAAEGARSPCAAHTKIIESAHRSAQSVRRRKGW